MTKKLLQGMWWQGREAEKVEAGVLKVLPDCVANAGRPTITHVFQVATVMAPTLVKVSLSIVNHHQSTPFPH